VFAPREIGRLGLCNLIHEQSVQQVLILICYLRAKSNLGIAFKLLKRAYQLWAGLSCHILEDTQPCPWIPTHWVSHLCNTMHRNQTQICYNSWKVLPLCQQDRHLMEDCAEQNYSMVKLEQLNACRMYLQVTTLAKITDHTGTELLPQAFPDPNRLNLRKLDTISSSLLQWSMIAIPSAACWRIWSNTIHMIILDLEWEHVYNNLWGPGYRPMFNNVSGNGECPTTITCCFNTLQWPPPG